MVRVHVTPPEDSSDADEVAWAHRLGRKLQEEFKPWEDGDVVVHAKVSAYGYGQKYNDIDIVVFGIFPNGIDRAIDCLIKQKDSTPRHTKPGETIRFYSICMTFEVKSHDPRSVRVVGLNTIQVQYDDAWKDVSDQSEGQKQALRAILKDKIGSDCWVANAIWLTSFDRTALPREVPNVLSKIIVLDDLLRLYCRQNPPYQSNLAYPPFVSSVAKDDQVDYQTPRLVQLLGTLKRSEVQSVGSLTPKRLEYITATLLNEQQYAKAIGQKLVIIQGKPGTGKTVKLLRMAHDLANRDGARVRILTYNLALVSDIKRLIALSGINDDGAGVVDIGSLDRLFWELISISGLGDQINYDNYFDIKDDMLDVLEQALNTGVVTDEDIEEWKLKRTLRYDYIFVDEGQDWPLAEQSILLRIFGHEHVVVADGIDQIVRRKNRSDWSQSVEPQFVHRVSPERRCLRQKFNLNEFNRIFARMCEISWDLESRNDFPGGRVIIATNGFNREIYAKAWEECQRDGNKGYEMLFMVPPSMACVNRIHGFGRRAEFESWGMQLWDGTIRDTRKEYPTELSEHRVIQYESCRGLEAWTSICLGLDEIFAEKYRTWRRMEDQMSLEEDEEVRIRDAYKWCMIPLTRAIDTTVITLTNPESEFSRKLLEAADRAQDFVKIL